jgi:arsenate reductase-like glutaredoxin family protein
MKLEDLLEREKELGIRGDVPALVTRCVDYLLPAHVKEEGLFRLSGAATDIQKMRDAIDKGSYCIQIRKKTLFSPLSSLTSYPAGEAMQMLADSPHNVAGLLKLFIRSLPDPLVPESVQVRYLVLPDLDDREMQRSVLFDLISDLPLPNLRLLRVLFAMMSNVASHSEDNKMTASNLATCWAPNIFWSAAETSNTIPTPEAAQKMIEFSRQANAVFQIMIEEQAHLFKPREFEKFYNMTALESPRGSDSTSDGTPRAAMKSRKRSRAVINATPSPSPSGRSARRGIRSEMIGSYDQVLAANALPAIDESVGLDESLASPAPKKRKTSAASLFSSAASAVMDSPKIVTSIGKAVSRRMSERRRTAGPASAMCLLFYYDDSKQSQALRKLLSGASMTPCEIRDETKDPMTFEEIKVILQGVESIIVVKKNGQKAYTETHPVTTKLTDVQLGSLLINSANGNVKAPLIIVGTTMVIGYEKDVEAFLSCYLFHKKN